MSALLPVAGSERPTLAFTCYSADTADAVLATAEEREAAVILLISEQRFLQPSGRRLVAAMRAMIDASSLPATLQLDHTRDLHVAAAALDCGVQAVMADGSELDFSANVEFTRSVAELAHKHGGWVEGELGHVPGDEEDSESGGTGQSGGTDPLRAKDFVASTSVDLLAVAIGNLHGRYPGTPVLDFGLLEELNDVAGVPLSLHGASGLTPADLRRSISLGIRKVNFNTELREAWFASVRSRLDGCLVGARQLELLGAVQRDVCAVIESKFDQVR